MSDVDSLVEPVSDQLGSGFLRDYVRWVTTQTDAPVAYHVATGLGLLSAVACTGAFTAFGTTRNPVNLYVMLVGGSGRERKSSALGLGERILREASPDRVGMRFGSYEALLDELVANPVQAMFNSEFSTFLAQSKGGTSNGYLAALKTGLTDVYDGTPISRVTRKTRVDLTQHRLSLITAISGSYLEEYTTPSDFTGGFLSRWLFSYADRTRFLDMPEDSEPIRLARAALVERLRDIRLNPTTGTFVMRGSTGALYLQWAKALDDHSAVVDRRAVGLYERAAALTRKIAALMAIDRMVSNGYRSTPFTPIPMDDDPVQLSPFVEDASTDFDILEEDLRPAMSVVAAHLASGTRIVSTIAHSEVAQMKARVLACVPHDRMVVIGYVSKTVGVLRRKAQEILDTLEAEGLVERVNDHSRGAMYTRCSAPITLSTERTPVNIPSFMTEQVEAPAEVVTSAPYSAEEVDWWSGR